MHATMASSTISPASASRIAGPGRHADLRLRERGRAGTAAGARGLCVDGSCRHLLGHGGRARPARSRDPPLLGRDAVAADELVGDHDDSSTMTPCMICTISLETSLEVEDCRELSRNAHSSAPKAMPTGWLRPSSAIAMPVKPRPVGNVETVGVGLAEQQRHADQAGDAAGEQHRREHHALTSTPLATAADSERPGGPQVEAEAGAAEQHRVADAGEHGDDDEAEDVAAGCRGSAGCRGTRATRPAARSPMMLLPGDIDADLCAAGRRSSAGRDRVEHDRRDDLADTPRVTFSRPAMPAQIAPTSIATSTITRMCNGPGSADARHRRRRRRTPRGGTGRRRRC